MDGVGGARPIREGLIDDHTPGGISGGGAQELVADAFGAATERFANEPSPFDTSDFTVAERVNLVGSGPIRNMANPSALGDPDCFSSSIQLVRVATTAPGRASGASEARSACRDRT